MFPFDSLAAPWRPVYGVRRSGSLRRNRFHCFCGAGNGFPNTGSNADPNTGTYADPNAGAYTGTHAGTYAGADTDTCTGANAGTYTGAYTGTDTGAGGEKRAAACRPGSGT